MSASFGDRERTALSKGQSLAAQVTRVKYGVYQVPSQSEPGTRWTIIQRADGGLQCVCPAGLVGRPCAHKAAVVVRRQREEKRGRRRAQAAAEATPKARRDVRRVEL